MSRMGKSGGDEGERGERRCLIIQQYQCSLFMALLDEPGGTVHGPRPAPKKMGNKRESVIR